MIDRIKVGWSLVVKKILRRLSKLRPHFPIYFVLIRIKTIEIMDIENRKNNNINGQIEVSNIWKC